MSGPLSGLRVLDLSRVLAGPWSAQILGDLGAEVIKVERPGSGDDTRNWGPPYLKGQDGSELSAYFLSANRNKTQLTERELSILRLLAAGYGTKQIAGELFISGTTLKRDLRSTYAKLGAHNRAEAIAKGYEQKLL